MPWRGGPPLSEKYSTNQYQSIRVHLSSHSRHYKGAKGVLSRPVGWRVRVDRCWALNPFTRAARSRWIQGRGFCTATPEIKLKRWLKTWERWLFHGHASLPPLLPPPTDYSPTRQIFTAAPAHDATRNPTHPQPDTCCFRSRFNGLSTLNIVMVAIDKSWANNTEQQMTNKLNVCYVPSS